jgi:CheY-like chemotaxis protein
MPMMTGYEAARIIAKEQPHIPVIFLSAKGLRREVAMAYESGPMVVDYLIKPIAPNALVNHVENIIDACQVRGLEAIRAENMARELVVEWQ